MSEGKTVLQRIFEVANDTTSDGTISMLIIQDNMKEIVQEISEKYIEKDKLKNILWDNLDEDSYCKLNKILVL